MKPVSIKWILGFLGNQAYLFPEEVTICRYDSGNYYIYDNENFYRTTCKELEEIAPGALSLLRRKAGVRKYAVS